MSVRLTGFDGLTCQLDLDSPIVRGTCQSVEQWEKISRIGEGTYGVVYRARHRSTGEIVALKKVRMEEEHSGLPIYSLREISLLTSLSHQNVVKVKEIVVGESLESIYLVMEYCEQDMAFLLDNQQEPFTFAEIKCLLKQLLKGIAYLHSKYIIHRDIKLSNILLNADGILKIADFGLARRFADPQFDPLTPEVVTLWYRAPEILLGDREYGEAVDIWSAGCVFGEWLGHTPLFPGNTELEQMASIVALLGWPTIHDWPALENLPRYPLFKFPKNASSYDQKMYKLTKLKERFPTASKAAIDLLSAMLTYNPEKRISSGDILNHEYFKELPLDKDPSLHLHNLSELRNKSVPKRE